MGRRVLLTQSFLYSFGGSEVITLELAEHFVAAGDEVLVAVHGYSAELAGQLRAVAGSATADPPDAARLRLFRLRDDALTAALAERPVDLAWIHQGVVPETLLRDPGRTTFVFNHMSSFHPLEMPFAYRIEEALASAVLFPSPEAQDAVRATGLLDGIPDDRLAVLGNPAPDAFAEVAREPASPPRQVLVVSNHLPAELLDAVALLREHLDVRIIGLEDDKGGRPARVTPQTLSTADLVVTIGKTVQFGLVSGVPVYCYDHFGGPGWLDESNVASAGHHNFSGRGFGRKSAESIAHEVLEGYEAARRTAAAWRDARAREHLLSTRLADVLDRASRRPRRGVVAPRDATAHVALQSSIGTFAVMAFELDATRRALTERLDAATRSVSELEGWTAELDGRVQALRDAAAARERDLAASLAWSEKLQGDVDELRDALAAAEARTHGAGTD